MNNKRYAYDMTSAGPPNNQGYQVQGHIYDNHNWDSHYRYYREISYCL